MSADSSVTQRRPGWMPPEGLEGKVVFLLNEQGACFLMDTVMFYPEDGPPNQKKANTAKAKAVCADCPVLVECRAHYDAVEALNYPHNTFGIVGGETPRERLRRREQVPTQPCVLRWEWPILSGTNPTAAITEARARFQTQVALARNQLELTSGVTVTMQHRPPTVIVCADALAVPGLQLGEEQAVRVA